MLTTRIPRVHLLGLPHTSTARVLWDHCAFTSKIIRLADMLTAQGVEVVLYGHEENEARVFEHVAVWTEEDRVRWFGDTSWTTSTLGDYDPASAPWAESSAGIIDEMEDRLDSGDFIAVTIGTSQRAVVEAFPQAIPFESGVGYSGSWLQHRVFESRAWQHWIYGRQGIDSGRFFDAVIPNAYAPNEFFFSPRHDDYLLFLGRHIAAKGLNVVEEIAKHHRVLSAGPGSERIPGVEHVGTVRGREKALLLAGAKALLAPTLYIEPFGGVSVEAQMSGTPVLATPWGAFPETVEHGRTGFLCHTLGEFLAGIDRLDTLSPTYIANRAERRYSTATVGPLYRAYLDRLALLRAEGWYTR